MTITMPVNTLRRTLPYHPGSGERLANRTHLLAITTLLKMVTNVFMKALSIEGIVVATRSYTLGRRRACGLVELTLSWVIVSLLLVVFCTWFCTVRLALSIYQ